MAKTPTLSAAPMPPAMPDDAAPLGDDDMGTSLADGGGEDGAEESEDVLLTVCKEPDGTYSLIKGDEQDADGTDTAGSATDSDKQTFDNIGSLLKAILDVLNEDKSSAGAPGDSEDQFNAGFDENAPPKPASPIPQKY